MLGHRPHKAYLLIAIQLLTVNSPKLSAIVLYHAFAVSARQKFNNSPSSADFWAKENLHTISEMCFVDGIHQRSPRYTAVL